MEVALISIPIPEEKNDIRTDSKSTCGQTQYPSKRSIFGFGKGSFGTNGTEPHHDQNSMVRVLSSLHFVAVSNSSSPNASAMGYDTTRKSTLAIDQLQYLLQAWTSLTHVLVNKDTLQTYSRHYPSWVAVDRLIKHALMSFRRTPLHSSQIHQQLESTDPN